MAPKSAFFFASLTALIPLTALIRLSVEELTLYLQLAPGIWLGHVLGGFVDCVLGYERRQTPTWFEALTMSRSTPELIFSMVALQRGETLIVQTAVIGAILLNSLLVLGFCFVMAGWHGSIEDLPQSLTQANSQMLMIALGSLIMPAAFVAWSKCEFHAWSQGEILLTTMLAGIDNIDPLSHGAAIVLLLLYVSYFLFLLRLPSWRRSRRLQTSLTVLFECGYSRSWDDRCRHQLADSCKHGCESSARQSQRGTQAPA